jgi:hypothetical protein
MSNSNDFKNFQEFWPFYVKEHRKPATRWMHFVGTAFLIPIIYLAISTSALWIIAIPLVGYGFAWTSHFGIEKNKPATFKYPFWSFISDLKMFWFMLTGKMNAEVKRICGDSDSAAA